MGQPRDFLSDDFPAQNQNDVAPRDFLAEPDKESLGTSIALALPRMGEDVIKSGYNAIKSIPKYYEMAKTEVPGVLDVATQHPVHALSQIAAGTAEMGQNLFNLPHDIANYASTRLNLLPGNINQKIQMARMPDSEQQINATFDTPQYPGETLLRGAARNAENILAPINLKDTALNPLKYTNKAIAEDVVNTRQAMKDKYSGQGGLYDWLSNEAEKQGITQANIDPDKIDTDTIYKYGTEKSTASLDKFLNDKNLTNAQKAISDLGFTQRKLENQTGLNSEEKEHYNAVMNAKNYIQDNMFKDNNGVVNQPLLDLHKNIQQGYAKEVVPYTTNKAINGYLRNEKTAGQLVQSLRGGKFPAQRGAYHPEIARQQLAKSLTNYITKLGTTAGLGAIGIEHYLSEKNNNE